MKYCYNCIERIENSATICPYCKNAPTYEAPPSHLKPGTRLNGKYIVGRALGQGGFGITYLGRDTALDTPVAIKEYFWRECAERNNQLSNAITLSVQEQKESFIEGKDRFIKEARTLAKFRDEPSVVSVWDVFEENNTAYLVMEYLRGTDLWVYLRNRGKMSSNELFPKLRPIIQALGEIHNHGIIHRDIKPQNIMLMANGKLKLLDFGAAREFGGDKSLTAILSPGFAPEEQYRRKGKQGPWTDVYALCATIYYCLTKAVPEDARDRAMEDDDELAAPSKLGAIMSKSEEAAIMRGLSIRSKDRFQSMSELEDALFAKEEMNQPVHSPSGVEKKEQRENPSRNSFKEDAISINGSVVTPASPQEQKASDRQTIDFAFCIDISKQMLPHIKTIVGQINTLVHEAYMQKRRQVLVRGRIILFCNQPADQNIFSTPFFDCAKSFYEMTSMLEQAAASLSGADESTYVSGLEALSDAMNSPWTQPGSFKNHIIVVWSNGMTRDEGKEKSLACPRSFSQLSAMWNNGIMNKSAKALVLFAPDKGDWKKISDTWNNVLHAPSEAGEGVDDGVLITIVHKLVS